MIAVALRNEAQVHGIETNKFRGSSFEDFLRDEGIFEECDLAAKIKVDEFESTLSRCEQRFVDGVCHLRPLQHAR